MIIVSADMEGVSGISRWAEVTPGDPAYEYGRSALAHDVATVSSVYVERGMSVSVVDGHWFGTNLRADEIGIPVTAGSRMPFGMVEGVQAADVEGVVLLGYHGMAGSTSVMCHTWSSVLSEVTLDGEPIGEIGLSALLCASVGAPVIGLSGDDIACHEVRQMLPDLPVAETKRAIGHEAAVLYPDARTRLRTMAHASLGLLGRRAPKDRERRIAARLSSVSGADRASIAPGTSRHSPCELSFTGDIRQCFNAMRTWAALANG